MGRDIKFRAWDDTEEEMLVCGDNIDIIFNLSTNEIECTDVRSIRPSGDGLIDKHYLSYLQYTGLKDKNGVEIYEGDVVEADISGIDTYEIVFVKGRFTMQSIIGGKDSLWILDEKCEVIGNIYENPELLQKEETN